MEIKAVTKKNNRGQVGQGGSTRKAEDGKDDLKAAFGFGCVAEGAADSCSRIATTCNALLGEQRMEQQTYKALLQKQRCKQHAASNAAGKAASNAAGKAAATQPSGAGWTGSQLKHRNRGEEPISGTKFWKRQQPSRAAAAKMKNNNSR